MLSILLDSSRWEMCLPNDKLAALQTEIQSWIKRRHCMTRQLLSSVGSLSFAAKVVPLAGHPYRRCSTSSHNWTDRLTLSKTHGGTSSGGTRFCQRGIGGHFFTMWYGPAPQTSSSTLTRPAQATALSSATAGSMGAGCQNSSPGR